MHISRTSWQDYANYLERMDMNVIAIGGRSINPPSPKSWRDMWIKGKITFYGGVSRNALTRSFRRKRSERRSVTKR